MAFRTEISFSSSSQLSLEEKFFCMGSCFAENISRILQSYRLPVCSNPFGMTYNPCSIAASLERILGQRQYKLEDLIEDKGFYLSLDHHGDFSNSSAESCLAGINQSLREANQSLEESSVLVLTLGTAFVYREKQSGKVVNNCHRLPAAKFKRELLKSDEMTSILAEVLTKVIPFNPKLKILISVSPVRHLRDSFPQNTLSKAQLISTAHTLAEQFAFVDYLPIYEILMDDLRDYRFYEEDMIHPNKIAIDYVWQKFSHGYFDESAHETFKRLAKLKQMQEHRPRNTEGEDYARFIGKREDLQAHLRKDYPFLDW